MRPLSLSLSLFLSLSQTLDTLSLVCQCLQIEVDMNNILAAQYGRFNPVAYRILPSFESVHTEIMARHSRRVLIDCGAGT